MITVGLDFGTHQTKICIEDAGVANQKTYRFFEFELNSEKSFFLPSIVQINNDNTISYGVIDNSKCLQKTSDFITDQIYLLKKPILNLPVLELEEFPKEPTKKPHPSKPSVIPYPQKSNKSNNGSSYLDTLASLKMKMTGLDENALFNSECRKVDKKNYENELNWKKKCASIDWNYDNRIFKLWKEECRKIEIANRTKVLDNENESAEILKKFTKTQREYKKNISSLYYLDCNDEGFVQSESMVFHHFKFAVFSDKINWYHQIKPEIISIWYLCNLLFMLQNDLGEDFSIQMGIPCGINQKYDNAQNEKGIKLLISAYNLLEKFDDHGSFLKTDYISLLEITNSVLNLGLEQKEHFGIYTMPEAFAALSAVTKGRKLQKGMSLLVDIGGGTTDIAFFTINDDKLPDIHIVSSLYTGLNDIFQGIAITEGKSVVQIQEYVLKTGLNLSNYKQVQSDFSSQISKGVNEITLSLKKSFNEQFQDSKLDIGKLKEAIANRPVIFSGGGSTFQELRFEIGSFTDVKVLDESLLKIPGLLNENIDTKTFTILATSYGLSQAIENELLLTPLSKLFAHIDTDSNNSSPNYIHGLTDH